MRKNLYIECSSEVERRMVISALTAIGYVWHRRDDHLTSPGTIETKWPWSTYPILIVNIKEKSLLGSNSGLVETQTADVIFTLAKDAEVKVELGNGYTAIVKKDNVTVRYQTFPATKIEELYAALKTVKENDN